METCKEIEVTEEMLEAGYRLLLDSGITDAQVEADRLVLAEIYRAMTVLSHARVSSNEGTEY